LKKSNPKTGLFTYNFGADEANRTPDLLITKAAHQSEKLLKSQYYLIILPAKPVNSRNIRSHFLIKALPRSRSPILHDWSHARLIFMRKMNSTMIDPTTANAAKVFLERIAKQFPVDHAILYGSRARHTHRPDSDADLAVIMNEQAGDRSATAVAMAGIAFDVLLDTGILVQALPLWRDELAHPEQFSNPALIHAIQLEGIRL
jgi:predicted nucleotidyltransferase